MALRNRRRNMLPSRREEIEERETMHRCLFAIVTVTAFAGEIPGEFRLLPGSSSATMVLELTRRDTLVDASRILRVEASRLPGLSAEAFHSNGPQRFELTRDAGTFYFEGKADQGSVRGSFRFVENAAFASRLKGVVPNWYEPGVMFEYAVQDRDALSPLFVPKVSSIPWPTTFPGNKELHLRALKESGYPLLKPDLERLRIHNVQPDLLRQMKLSGYDALNTNDMVKLQSYGITGTDVLTFQVRGFPHLTADEMVKMKISGIPDNSAQPRP
jgi:hypothetical protein